MVLRKAERQHRILQMLAESANISIADMSRLTNVSEVTIRKDLQYLESIGKIFRTYGKIELTDSGRIRGNNCFIPPELQSGYAHKKRIGALAGQMVLDDDALFIGPGYTCLEVANHLKERKRLSVVTNNISAAIELACIPEFHVLTAPGAFTKRNGTYYVTGSATIQYMKELFVDKIFVTADGVSLDRGFSVLDDETARIFKALHKPSARLIVCVDSARFGRNAFAPMASFAEVDTVITDQRPERDFMDSFQENNVHLIYPDRSEFRAEPGQSR